MPAAQAEPLYELLSETEITFITVSSDPCLMDYHDLLLERGTNGAWMMVPRKHAVSV